MGRGISGGVDDIVVFFADWLKFIFHTRYESGSKLMHFLYFLCKNSRAEDKGLSPSILL